MTSLSADVYFYLSQVGINVFSPGVVWKQDYAKSFQAVFTKLQRIMGTTD